MHKSWSNSTSETMTEFTDTVNGVLHPQGGVIDIAHTDISAMSELNGSLFVEGQDLPKEMRFGVQHIVSITAYSCFFVIAAAGNLTVFITLFRNRNDKSRVNMFIMHLAIADLIVTFIMMPLEIGWHATVQWLVGDAACRILLFFRIFGLYLSSCVLVVISLDRYFAILHPLSLNDANKRGKIMLCFAWIFSAVASAPQSVIFHEEAHPAYPWFRQCVTFNFFPNDSHELVYNLFTMIAMYGLPLIIITSSYTLILREISKKTRQSREEMHDLNASQSSGRLRRSTVGNIERARSRTLKMTIVIVGVFVFCWTPYYLIAVWWWFDKESAQKLDPKIQSCLFIFAVSNSCVNPIIYGLFTLNFKREFLRCCCCLKRKPHRINRSLNCRANKAGKRSLYSSLQGSTTSSGLKIKMEKALTGDTVIKIPLKVSPPGKCSPKDASNENVKKDSRHNVNNFLPLHMKRQHCVMDKC